MNVSQAQLDHYHNAGYVVFEGGLTDADIDPLIEDHERVVDDIARTCFNQGKIADLCESEAFPTRLARLADQCDEIDGCPDVGATRQRATFEFLRNERLIDLIEPFIGPEITCNAVSHVRPKLPGTDVPFHQDAIFTTQEAKDNLQVTVWVPLVDATPENGCLEVQAGVHRARTVFWKFGSNLPEQEPVQLPMRKGDVLIMHKLTPHGSGPNSTDAVRWSMDLRYQQTGKPSPRPEWPVLICRSRRDPSSETLYEEWCDQWATGLEETPKQLSYKRPDSPLPYEGVMYLD